MKMLLMLLSGVLGKSFADDADENQVVTAVKAALQAKDDQIATLQQEKASLAAQAEDGKAFRESLGSEFVRMKAALGEADTDATKQAGVKAFAVAMPLEMLKAEVKHLETRMRAKFPDGQLQSGDPNANRGEGKDDDNPLVVKDTK